MPDLLQEAPAYVLVIEEDAASRDRIANALEIEGFRVVAVATGNDAVQFLQTSKPVPRVILLDMLMTGMNGWQFLDFQRHSGPLASVPVVVCTAFNETARSVNPAAIVPKPIQMKTLVETVKNHFHSTVEKA